MDSDLTSIESNGKELAFKTKMSAYREEANLYISWQITETMNTDTTWINSGEVLKDAIDQGIVVDITISQRGRFLMGHCYNN